MPHDPIAPAVEAPSSQVSTVPAPRVGDPAPDFLYQSHDYRWKNLHDMLGIGHVMLVFAPDEATYRLLEQDQEALLSLGVVPVAVVPQRDAEAWSVVRRLNLSFSLLADPRGVIAGQYGAHDATTRHTKPGWCVVGQDGRVRSIGMGPIPGSDARGLAVEALGLGATRTASTR